MDVISGGFPCQPYSTAGKRLGKEDERHLWPEMLRAIREVSPRWVVGENVRGLVNWNDGLVFDEVQADLEAEGYEVQPFLLPACAVNAPHRRDRIWFVAHADSARRQEQQFATEPSKPRQFGRDNSTDPGCLGLSQPVADGKLERFGFGKRGKRQTWDAFPSEPPVCGGNDGLSGGLDGITFPKWRNESIKAYGNAVVPQVVHQIFKAIEEYETITSRPTDGLPPT